MANPYYEFKGLGRKARLLNENASDTPKESQPPDMIEFESTRDAFVFACGTCTGNYNAGDALLGFVETIDESTVTKEKVAIYRLKVQSPNGGKFIPHAISGLNVPNLKKDDLIVFKVHSDNTKPDTEELTGMVGVIVAKVEPKLHLLNGWIRTD
jgi:hypothetical protein